MIDVSLHVCVAVGKGFVALFPCCVSDVMSSIKMLKSRGTKQQTTILPWKYEYTYRYHNKGKCMFPMQIHGTAFSQICWRSECKSKTISEDYRFKPLSRVTLAEVVVNWPRLPARPHWQCPPARHGPTHSPSVGSYQCYCKGGGSSSSSTSSSSSSSSSRK